MARSALERRERRGRAPVLRARAAALGLIALTAGSLAGCGGDEAEGTGEPGEVAVDLREQNDANIAGARATFRYEDKGSTLVTVDGLDGGERPGVGPNPVRIVRGSCEEPGRVAFELEPLRSSISETRIAVGLNDLYEGDFAVQVLFSKTGSEALACGDVPDEPPG